MDDNFRNKKSCAPKYPGISSHTNIHFYENHWFDPLPRTTEFAVLMICWRKANMPSANLQPDVAVTTTVQSFEELMNERLGSHHNHHVHIFEQQQFDPWVLMGRAWTGSASFGFGIDLEFVNPTDSFYREFRYLEIRILTYPLTK